MKSKRNYFIGFFVIFLLASCGNGIQNQSGIKLIPVQSGKDYQYINKKGKIVINPQFSEATMFREGLALVKTTGNEPRWGFISEDGKYAVNAQYIEATVFSDGLAWVVTENSAPTVIDTKGNIKFALSVAEQTRIFRNGLAAYSTVSADGEEKWGFVNKSGQVKINPQFTETDDFNEGICAVRNKDGKWGYIDTDGSLTINYQFDEAQSFKNGKAIVELGGKLGVINKDGKYLINPQFTGLVNDRDIFLVNQNDRWGWCDKDGSITINPQFDFALPFYDNELAPVRSDRNFGYIDKEGR